jgi:SAM-dependent methyltransferase
VKNLDFYQKAFKKHGVSARGLNWYSEDSQKIRFEVLASFLKDEIFSSSIVDAGCGFGDFYLFLEKQNLIPKQYIGIDCVQDFIDISKQRLPNRTFTCRDILRDELVYADWYVASGSLNILNSFDTWVFLEKMLSYSKKGVVFNILQGDKKSKTFNYQKKEDIISFAKKKGHKIKLIEEYLLNDISVEIRK